jgi:hypothetical protein
LLTQPGVLAEEIDSISRLPLAGGEQVVGSVQVQLLKLALEMTHDDYGIRQTAIHENCGEVQTKVTLETPDAAVMADNGSPFFQSW